MTNIIKAEKGSLWSINHRKHYDSPILPGWVMWSDIKFRPDNSIYHGRHYLIPYNSIVLYLDNFINQNAHEGGYDYYWKVLTINKSDEITIGWIGNREVKYFKRCKGQL